ncbi:MAG: hypothetical protein AAGG80_06975 [Pseudomonadota bacterium]
MSSDSSHRAKLTAHGVFIQVLNLGVMLTGKSGIGKSELALGLINKGYKLIADDAINFTKRDNKIIGTAEAVLQDFLEVRGLGILNIRKMFGDTAIAQSYQLDLIVHIKQFENSELSQIDRLNGIYTDVELLGNKVPEVTIPVSPGRHLAVLVEAAVRNQMLKLSGYDAGQAFQNQQANFLQQLREPHER